MTEAYLIATSPNVKSAEMTSYAQGAARLLAQFGAERLGAGPIACLEGKVDGEIGILLRFPSRAVLDAFWSSAEYQSLKRLREGLDFRIFVLDGMAQARPHPEPAPIAG